ncbi:MAG: sulfatase-like hydrolase/transferase [Candidatus Eisenbacteria bacterium]|nr:sulfatase-like hydrolase/transferase [Candidatus Eisenbacteria bacterium]
MGRAGDLGSTWIGMCLATGLLVGASGCDDDSAGGGGAESDAIANWKPGTLGGWTSATAPSGERWNVLLLTLDTTRADRLKCYGWTQESSPNLDAMASEGVLFERARAATPVTLPSHTSILTGLYPFQHGVRNNGTYVVPEDDTTLAELFKQQGYDTGAILAAFPVAEQFGLSQGFDHYDDRFPLSSQRRESDTAQRIAGDVTRLSLEWIDGRGGKPFFLWAHFFDPHFPHAPPEPFRSRFASDPYVGEIAYMDAEIGNLMAGLKSRGLLEKTVILAIADHGESLGEHREVTHSIFVYNATQHVPCILRLPNGGAFAGPKWRGQRVAELVSHVDVIPTLWNAAGLPREALPPLSGRSLLPLVDQKAPGHDWIYAETLVPEQEYGASDLRALETEAWKFIRAPKRELYDLVKDPKELSNLEARETKRADGMAKDLETLLQLEAGGAQVTMDPETIEKLRSLGYLAGASASSKSSGPKPDPKDMIWAYEAVNEARNRAAEHQPEAAIALCDSVLKKHPEDGTAQRIRASCLIRLNRGDEAVAAYDAILAACGGCADELALLRNRAIAAMTANQLDDALARTRALLEAHPKEQGLNLLLGQVLQSKGRPGGSTNRDPAGDDPLPRRRDRDRGAGRSGAGAGKHAGGRGDLPASPDPERVQRAGADQSGGDPDRERSGSGGAGNDRASTGGRSSLSGGAFPEGVVPGEGRKPRTGDPCLPDGAGPRSVQRERAAQPGERLPQDGQHQAGARRVPGGGEHGPGIDRGLHQPGDLLRGAGAAGRGDHRLGAVPGTVPGLTLGAVAPRQHREGKATDGRELDATAVMRRVVPLFTFAAGLAALLALAAGVGPEAARAGERGSAATSPTGRRGRTLRRHAIGDGTLRHRAGRWVDRPALRIHRMAKRRDPLDSRSRGTLRAGTRHLGHQLGLSLRQSLRRLPEGAETEEKKGMEFGLRYRWFLSDVRGYRWIFSTEAGGLWKSQDAVPIRPSIRFAWLLATR